MRADVVGLPLNMDGTSGKKVRETIAWTNALLARIETKAQIVYVDERLSSFEAEQQLIDRKRDGEKITRKSKREMLDALAACAFLQEFLDGKLSAIDVEAL